MMVIEMMNIIGCACCIRVVLVASQKSGDNSECDFQNYWEIGICKKYACVEAKWVGDSMMAIWDFPISPPHTSLCCQFYDVTTPHLPALTDLITSCMFRSSLT
jgi:hypothetical protein